MRRRCVGRAMSTLRHFQAMPGSKYKHGTFDDGQSLGPRSNCVGTLPFQCFSGAERVGHSIHAISPRLSFLPRAKLAIFASCLSFWHECSLTTIPITRWRVLRGMIRVFATLREKPSSRRIVSIALRKWPDLSQIAQRLRRRSYQHTLCNSLRQRGQPVQLGRAGTHEISPVIL